MLLSRFSRRNRRIVAIAIFSVSAAYLLLILVTNKKPETPTPTDKVITYSVKTPSEIKPVKDKYNWLGGSEDPKYIDLPSIGGGGYIQKVGVDQNKQVAVPNNVYLAGWFVDSVRPGKQGLSIIVGHIDGRKDPGIFEKLGKLKEDDDFSVELGSGKKLSYQIINTTTVKEADTPNILFSQNPKIASQLNLITCGGTYNNKTHSYPDRVIINAKLN